MKKTNFILLILLLLTSFAITGCGKTNNKVKNNDYEPLPPMPAEVVENYMKHTLGTIPGAEIDYEKAKEYLTDELKAQFVNPMFVPTSYCIQDGPEDMRIVSDQVVAGGSIGVIVEGKYGGEWIEMWRFLVTPVGNLSWAIEKIQCLNN